MPDKAFFDTNLLIYAVAQYEPRTARAEQLLMAGGVISVQVLNEFVSVARRKLGMQWRELKEALQSIRTLCPATVPITIATHDLALTIAERHNYGIYDALVIASALIAKCDVLLSEDLHDGQVIEKRLRIQNPFR